MWIYEIKHNVFKLAKTPAHFKWGIIVDSWKLRYKILNSLMQQATLLSIQAHYIEVPRDLVNSFLNLLAAFVYGMCIFREKTPFFLFFVDCH